MTDKTSDQTPQAEAAEEQSPPAEETEEQAPQAEETQEPTEEKTPEAPKPAPVDDVVESSEPEFPPVENAAQAKGIIEALLFSSSKSLSARRLAGMMPGWKERAVLDILAEIKAEYEERSSGLMLQEVAGGWTIATRPQWAEWVYGLHKTRKRNPLTPQALETLAIIAYKQPITRADIEVIRGVDAGGMLRNLLDLNLVEVVGHRETVGRPPLYGTGDLFLRTFGLKTLGDLPSVDELKSLMQRTQVELPLAEEDADAESDEEADEGNEETVEETASSEEAPAEDAADAPDEEIDDDDDDDEEIEDEGDDDEDEFNDDDEDDDDFDDDDDEDDKP